MRNLSNNILARKGEDIACKYLQNKSYQIIDRNFRNRNGEIDIIAKDKNTLVFVEVKTRISKSYGKPEEAVTKWKLQLIVKCAKYYKLLNPNTPELLRVDLVAIDMEDTPCTITHLENLTQ